MRIILAFFTVACALLPLHQADSSEHPNLVLILADDFGVGDIQAHYPDNKIATPYLDKLVADGISFADAHSPSAVCSPTRYGLLTGRYAWRTRLQEWVIAAYEPPLIHADRMTLPSMLKQHGYHTACIGKWHLGWNWPGPQPSRMTEQRNGQKSLEWDFAQPIAGGPTARGFDHYFGVDLPNLPPFTYIEGNRVVAQPTAKFSPDPAEGIVLPRGFVGTPAAPGWRMQDVLPEITRRAVDYIGRRANQEEPFFLYFSMTSPHEPVVPSQDFRGKSGIAPIADFVMETDWSAGQVIEAIDRAGVADNTIVIFTADNGHSHYTGWDDLVAAGHQPSGPFRGHKGDIWEGGHRVPLVIRWPNRARAGSTSRQLVSLTDLMATCAQLVGAKLPVNAAEDSISFLPSVLSQSNPQARRSLVSHSNFGEFAYREDDWKLVFRNQNKNLQQSRGKQRVAELYHLNDDVAESKNVAEQRPEVREGLTQKLQSLIDRGASRQDAQGQNDTKVRFDITQPKRWGDEEGVSGQESGARSQELKKSQ